jgi:predicted alpha/beta superfamily hydrolase
MKPAFKLPAPETGTEYWIYVHQTTEAGGQKTEPLIPMLVLDGDDMFQPMVESSKKAGVLPPLLLVGVGYGGSFSKPANKRVRDYTPVKAHDEPTSGGADKFLQFLTQTLWPELAKRYPLREGLRGLGGYSLSALFVLHALFQPKPFFTHHLAGSPSIWWSDAAILKQVAAIHAQEPGLRGQLFLSVGDKDSVSMTGDLVRLEQQLAALAFPRLKASVRRFPGKDHYNALPDAFRAGLGALFA